MVNAESIIEMARKNPESLEKLAEIVNAYNEIQNVVYNELKNAKPLEKIQSKIKSSEFQFWLDKDYNRNSLYVVVEFINNECFLYIKNDNEDKDQSRSLSTINFQKYNNENIWYHPKKESDRKYSLSETDKLIKKIKNVIEELKSING